MGSGRRCHKHDRRPDICRARARVLNQGARAGLEASLNKAKSLPLSPRPLHSALFADGFVGLGYGFEFDFCCFLDIFSEGGYFVRVVFDCHLAVGFLHLVVCGAWVDLEDSVVAVVVWTIYGEDRV